MWSLGGQKSQQALQVGKVMALVAAAGLPRGPPAVNLAPAPDAAPLHHCPGRGRFQFDEGPARFIGLVVVFAPRRGGCCAAAGMARPVSPGES